VPFFSLGLPLFRGISRILRILGWLIYYYALTNWPIRWFGRGMGRRSIFAAEKPVYTWLGMETNKRFVCQSIALYFAECHNLCQCGYMAMWPTLSLQSRLVAAQSIPVKAAASIQIPRVNRWPADRIVLDRIGGVNRRMRGTFGQTTRRMLNYMVVATCWPAIVCC